MLPFVLIVGCDTRGTDVGGGESFEGGGEGYESLGRSDGDVKLGGEILMGKLGL